MVILSLRAFGQSLCSKSKSLHAEILVISKKEILLLLNLIQQSAQNNLGLDCTVFLFGSRGTIVEVGFKITSYTKRALQINPDCAFNV